MRNEYPTTTVTIEQVTQSVLKCLHRLLQKRRLDEPANDDFAAARSRLEAMPLSTDQFDRACARLKNAQQYLEYTEPGAARYELRLLASSLKNSLPQVREPHRRLRRKS